MNWSQCVKLYEGLRNGQQGVDDRIREVNLVRFTDFICSFKSVDKNKLEEETQAVHEVLKRSRHLDKVLLWDCDLEDVHIKLLLRVFAGVKLTELNVGGNGNISPEGWLNLGRLVKQSELKKLLAENCDIKDEDVKKLCQGMDGAKLAELKVFGNRNISPEGWLNLGRLVKQSELKKLLAQCCNIEDEDVKKLCQGMDGAKLTELNVNGNRNISPEGWLNLGRLVKQSELKKLDSRLCGCQDEDVKKLCQGMDGAKLDCLDLFDWPHRPSYTPSLLELLPLVNEELVLVGWQINETERSQLLEKLNQKQLTTLTIVLSYGAALKASPLNLPPTLPQVDNVGVEKDGDGYLVTWNPLSTNDDMFYFIVVEHEGGSKVDSRIERDSKYRISQIQADIRHRVLIWGFNGRSISKYASYSDFGGRLDATSDVGNLKVMKSTRQFYEDHLTKSDTVYQILPDRQKGKVLIINNEFKGEKDERKGSGVDVSNMQELWHNLGFKVIYMSNLSARAMMKSCKDFADKSKDVSLVAVVIMTHGGKNEEGEFFQGEDGEPVLAKDVTSCFKTRQHLDGIPKIFMFQACRGEAEDTRSTPVGNTPDSPAEHDIADANAEQATSNERSAQGEDMLIIYPTQSGYVAYRNKEQGSWLINAVTNIFMKHAHDKDILNLSSFVNDAVSKKAREAGEGREGEEGRAYQSSNQGNSLRKTLYLFPGWPSNEQRSY